MILVALGANLPSRYGTPEHTLEAAKAELGRRGVFVIKSSRIIVNPPVPVSDQPYYRNAVIAVETGLGPRELFRLLKDIERDFGRLSAEKNAARVLDLDLLAYEGKIITEADLQIPHPRMHQREFVLGPLAEIAPEWTHPVLRQRADELFHSLPEKVSRETGGRNVA